MLFESKRLEFRVWEMTDAEAGFKLWGNPKVMAYIEPPLTRDAVKQSIQRGLEHYKKYGVQIFAMVLKDSREIIGCCGFVYEDETEYEFVIHMMPEYHRNGYGFEAGTAAFTFIEKHGYSKIMAACHLENQASKALLLKLGMTYVGDEWFEDTKAYECLFERLV